MELKPLSSNVIELIQSGSEINSYDQAVIELIQNSLDAKANCIAVRIDFEGHNIQVIDNGIGIHKANMKLVGVRYMTNKCESISDLNNKLNYYGYRGLALANLIKISETFMLESLYQDSIETFAKHFYKNKQCDDIELRKIRPSQGTTVTITNFLYNMKVRQRYANPLHDMEKIKCSMEALALIHFNVSFTLRDDLNKILIFKCQKSRSIKERFSLLINENIGNSLRLTSYSDDVYALDAYIAKERHKSKRFQYVFVNKHIVRRSDIHKALNKLLKSNKNILFDEFNSDARIRTFPIFLVNLICPYTTYDITSAPNKSMILFNNWDHVLNIIENTVNIFEKNVDLKKNESKQNDDVINEMVIAVLQENANKFGTSQLENAVKGKPAKRRKHDGRINNKKIHKISQIMDLNKLHSKINHISKKKKLSKKSSLMNDIKSGERSEIIFESKRQCDYRVKKCGSAVAKQRFDEIYLNLNRLLKKIKESAHRNNDNRIFNFDLHSSNLYNNTKNAILNSNNDIKTNYLKITSHKYKFKNNGISKRTSNIHNILKNKLYMNNFKHKKDNCVYFPNKNHILFEPISTNNMIKTDFSHTIKIRKYSQKPIKSHLNGDKEIYQNKKNIFTTNQLNHNYDSPESSLINRYHKLASSNECDEFIFRLPNVEVGTKYSFKYLSVSDKTSYSSVSFENICNKTTNKLNHQNTLNDIQLNLLSQDLNNDFIIKPPNIISVSNKFSDQSKNINSNVYDVSFCNSANKSIDIFIQSDENISRNELANETLNQINYSWNSSQIKIAVLNKKSNKEVINDQNVDSIVSQMKRMIIIDQLHNNIENQNNNGDGNFKMDNTDEFQCYKLFRRPCFIPKGMSPILKLSEENNINSANVKSRQHNLLTKNNTKITENTYYDKEMYKLFANEIVSNFDAPDNIIKIQNSIVFKLKNQLKYDKSILHSAKVINQVDNKFILAIFNSASYSHLVLFDQHAVDERIRLEKLLQDYKHDDNYWKSTNCIKPIKIILDQLNVNLLTEYREKFTTLGISFVINKANPNEVVVKSIPYCFIQKLDDEKICSDIIKGLILDELIILNETRGTVSKIPKIILDCVNMEACRGAIQFGTYLSKIKCEEMIKSLSKCNLPFQCAHGRPSVITLIDLKKRI